MAPLQAFEIPLRFSSQRDVCAFLWLHGGLRFDLVAQPVGIAEQACQPWGQQMANLLLLMNQTAHQHRARGAERLPQAERDELAPFPSSRADLPPNEPNLPRRLV